MFNGLERLNSLVNFCLENYIKVACSKWFCLYAWVTRRERERVGEREDETETEAKMSERDRAIEKK